MIVVIKKSLDILKISSVLGRPLDSHIVHKVEEVGGCHLRGNHFNC